MLNTPLDIDKNILNDNILLRVIQVVAVLLLVYRLMFFSVDSFLFLLINDILIISLCSALTLYLVKKNRKNDTNPLAQVLNSGIIAGFVFLLLMFGEELFNLFSQNFSARFTNQGFFENLVYSLYAFLLLFISCYWLAAFWELYFYKQHNLKAKYFFIMLIFMFLTAVSNLLLADKEFDYVSDTFFIISIILIALNSVKISWIAFISKKEKISLLILSIIISSLFFTTVRL